ncbi:MAG: hypothetical protein HQK60_02715 [Deltaproteobacteria bacterium]|nr:hypothetical protein [Deltaproteobacteria bacterium]
MEVCHYHIKNISLSLPVKIFIAQVDVGVKRVQDPTTMHIQYDFNNSLFDMAKFEKTLEVFHKEHGDVIVFPEYYLPIEYLNEVNQMLLQDETCNTIYIIPLCQISISDYRIIQQNYNCISEKIPQETRGDVYINIAIMFIKDKDRNLSTYCQLKTHPMSLEVLPFRETYEATCLWLWDIDEVLSFSILICYSLIGKKYDGTSSLSALKHILENEEIDYLFVPECNDSPTHSTFINAIREVGELSNGSTAVFMVNAKISIEGETASAGMYSSIMDVFPRRIRTTEYDMQELCNNIDLHDDRLKHLIFYKCAERLISYESFPPKRKKANLGPEFMKSIDIMLYYYEYRWIPLKICVTHEYRSHESLSTPWPHEDDLSKILTDLGSEEYNRRLWHLWDLVNGENLVRNLMLLTDAMFERRIVCTDDTLLKIYKFLGEFHAQRGCHNAACHFYCKMKELSVRTQKRSAGIVADFLLMQASSQINTKRHQKFSFEKAKELSKLLEDQRCVQEVGVLSASVLVESAIIIGHCDDTFCNMYMYGSYDLAERSRRYNLNEPAKKKRTDNILERAKIILDNHNITIEDPLY